LNFWVLP